jgi:SAM-dependent methyltransferase
MSNGWEWDETLFQGSAPYYARGRLPYAPGFVDALAQALDLDGTGRLLDVGCGPGTVTLPLAPRFADAVGIDPDQGMLVEARRRGERLGIDNVRWVRGRAEDLPAGLGPVRVALFAQSFHWTARDQVAPTVRDMLDKAGAFVQMSDVKEPKPAVGLPSVELPFPPPPLAAITELVRHYLGPVRRAGQGMLVNGTPGDEAAVLARAGFDGPERLRVPAGAVLERTTDDVIAGVYSLSYSAPHLFGDRRAEFAAELREILDQASATGIFSEQIPDTEILIWRK